MKKLIAIVRAVALPAALACDSTQDMGGAVNKLGPAIEKAAKQ